MAGPAPAPVVEVAPPVMMAAPAPVMQIAPPVMMAAPAPVMMAAPAPVMQMAPPVMMQQQQEYEMVPVTTMQYDMVPAEMPGGYGGGMGMGGMTMAAPAMAAAPMTMAGGYGGGMGMSAVPTTYGSAPTMGGGGLFNLVDTNQDGDISRSEFIR